MIGVGKLVAQEICGEASRLLEPFRFSRYAEGKLHPVSNSPFPWELTERIDTAGKRTWIGCSDHGATDPAKKTGKEMPMSDSRIHQDASRADLIKQSARRSTRLASSISTCSSSR